MGQVIGIRGAGVTIQAAAEKMEANCQGVPVTSGMIIGLTKDGRFMYQTFGVDMSNIELVALVQLANVAAVTDTIQPED